MKPKEASCSREILFASNNDAKEIVDSYSYPGLKLRVLSSSSLPKSNDLDDVLRMKWFHRWILLAVTMLWLVFSVFSATASSIEQPDNPIPLLAYYYIWFDRGSWDRAKSDFPLLGNYSSDDEDVIRQHVAWAKQVGIDGFIVSWKSTDQLNRRLEQLIAIADEAEFKLAVIYQGLDFERDPLSVDRISDDLKYFTDTYAENEVFNIYERPLVIWSGTWAVSYTHLTLPTTPYV